MKRGESLIAGDQLVSKNGKFRLELIEDLLVIFFNNFLTAGFRLERNPYRLSMLTNGNLILYDKQNATLAQLNNNGRGDFIVIQNDGNLVYFDTNGNQLFASGVVLSRPKIK